MTDEKRTAAVVGAAGGVGATRLSIEAAATLARAGESVAVLDAAFATQGLSQYVHGQIGRDVTRTITASDPDPDGALVDFAVDAPGSVSICPAYAAFSRIAEAKSPEAAERFGSLIAAAGERFDRVLVDTPPIADNPSVAAVTGCDAVALVTGADQRGADSLRRATDRLADVGREADLVVANRAEEGIGLDEDERHPIVGDADVVVPDHEVTEVTGAPVCDDPEAGAFAPVVASATEGLFGVSLELAFPTNGLLSFG